MIKPVEVTDEDTRAAESALYAITDDDCNMYRWPVPTLAAEFAKHRERLAIERDAALAREATLVAALEAIRDRDWGAPATEARKLAREALAAHSKSAR